MASTLNPKSKISPHLIGKNYEISLHNSLQEIFASHQNFISSNSSSFISNFHELMLCKTDPPLEAIWISTASKFNDLSVPVNEPLNSILVIKDLFQHVISYAASCGPIKSIALVAPVLYKLHYLMLDVRESQLGSKKERKANREIRNLVDSVLGYISVCCEGFDGNFDDLEGLMRPLGDLISFWVVDNAEQNKNVETLRVFFPFLSSNIVERVKVEGCGLADLAGFVVGEAILLKLCWKIQEEGLGEKTQNEIKSWLVGSITGLESSYLYVTLGSMVLEPVLPITSVMNSKYEDGVKEVLFGALLLVEYSFLTPERLGGLPVKHAKCLIFTKLIIAYEAFEFFGGIGNQAKAIPYLNAFANSSLPSQIIKLIRREIGNEFSSSCPSGSSPRALLRWMLNLENGGIKIFDDDLLKCRAKLILENSEHELEQLTSVGYRNRKDTDLFYIDNKGREENGTEDDEMAGRGMSAAFMAAAHKPRSSELGVRKRKARKGGKREQVKFVRLKLLEDSSLSGEQAAELKKNGGSEIENPSSDVDMVSENEDLHE